MTRTGYAVMKQHFDKIMTTGTPNPLAQIKDTYEFAFGTKIHMYDVYETSVRLPNNPITKIVTLVGEKDDSIKTGIIPCLNDICVVDICDKDYFKGVNEENVDEYIMHIYRAMFNIMIANPLFSMHDKIARDNPYIAFLKICPFYFTYHHTRSVYGKSSDREIFKELLEKFICNTDDISDIMESMISNKYSSDFEDIYRTMTCNGKIEILV